MAESKFVTDRRKRQEDYRASRPEIKPEKTRSVLRPGERLSGAPPAAPRTMPAPPMSMREAFEAGGGVAGLVASGAGELGRAAADAGRGYVSGVVEPTVSAAQYLATGSAPPRGAVMALGAPLVPSPNPNKMADRAAVGSQMAAAVLGAHEDPPGRGRNQKPIVEAERSHPPGGVGTGPGATAETPARPSSAGGPGPGRTQVKMPDGRFVFVTPDRGADYVAGGGSYASYQDATSGLGAPQAARFMKDREFRESAAPQPYSEQVRSLANSEPETPLDFEGDTGFGTSPPGSGGPAEGFRRLSGIEQALARRTWLEGRADAEQQAEAGRAETDRRTRLAEMDPLEIARIQAQGRAGGDLAKVQLDLRARQAAEAEFRRVSEQIAAAMQDPEVEQRYIDYLVQTRRELSNLLLGERLSDPRSQQDAFGAAIAGLGLAGGAGAPPAGER